MIQEQMLKFSALLDETGAGGGQDRWEEGGGAANVA